MLLFSEMLVQFGSLGMSLIAFLASKNFKFYVLNDQETNYLLFLVYLFYHLVVSTDNSSEFVPAVLYSSLMKFSYICQQKKFNNGENEF